MLSNTYFKSPACLNEMGAAWAMKKDFTGILLPEFNKDSLNRCCIGTDKIYIDLNDDNKILSFRLNELKDKIINDFNLVSIDDTYWDSIRDNFIDSVTNSR